MEPDELEEIIESGDMLDFVQAVVKTELVNLHTAIPAFVMEWTRATGKVTVQPAVRMRYKGEDVKYPSLVEVPVFMTHGKGKSITHDLERGDFGFVIFSERDPAPWLSTGNPDNKPVLRGMHSLNFAFFLPAGRPFAKPLKSVEAGAMLVGEDRYEGGGNEDTGDKPALKRLRVDDDKVELAWDHETKAKRAVGVQEDGAMFFGERSGGAPVELLDTLNTMMEAILLAPAAGDLTSALLLLNAIRAAVEVAQPLIDQLRSPTP